MFNNSFLFQNFPLKIFFLKKNVKCVRGQGLMNICTKFQVGTYLQKWLRYDIKHVKNRHFGTLPRFSEFYFFTDFDASKSVLGSFSRSLRESDLKTCIAALTHEFFAWPSLHNDLRWPWPLLWSQSTVNDTYKCQRYYPCRFVGFVWA